MCPLNLQRIEPSSPKAKVNQTLKTYTFISYKVNIIAPILRVKLLLTFCVQVASYCPFWIVMVLAEVQLLHSLLGDMKRLLPLACLLWCELIYF